MSVVAVYLDAQDVEDDTALMLYNIKDTSIEGLEEFITSFYSGVDEDDIQFYLFEDGSVDCATFTTVEEDFDYQELHWHLEVRNIVSFVNR